jgi:hypothetical protein
LQQTLTEKKNELQKYNKLILTNYSIQQMKLSSIVNRISHPSSVADAFKLDEGGTELQLKLESSAAAY